MTLALPTDRRRIHGLHSLCALLMINLLFLANATAQDNGGFDPIAAAADLEVARTVLDKADIESGDLTDSRIVVVTIESQASQCAQTAAVERAGLEARYEPLRDIDGDVSPTIFEQQQELRTQLDAAIERETLCTSLAADSSSVLDAITQRQTELSQQYLTARGHSVFGALRELPSDVRALPGRLRGSMNLRLVEGVTPLDLFWLLVLSGAIAAGLGIFIRHRFNTAYEAAGGDDAPPRMKYLFPKPLAQYAPLLLEGIALVSVLYATIDGASLEMAVVRLATGIFLFGLGSVVIDWATGPVSPAANVAGLVPDHVKPLRLRLRLFMFTMIVSFVVLGTRWLAIRMVDPDVAGRATMIFLVAISLLYTVRYLGRIQGIQGRFRLVRFLAQLALIGGLFVLFLGYQNFAGYLIHGVTRTALALFALWILLWLVYALSDYLTNQDSPTATRLRQSLGMSERTSKTGAGFMQLVVDIALWLSFLVFLVYVWDESGTTLDTLFQMMVLGIPIGEFKLVPLKIIGGILMFVGLMIAVGWAKRWIDRRWLQHIVIERGAREAVVTLFGYVGFIVAGLLALTQAGADLKGLAWIGGGLALGIGFGMQEIANNFVSGLILLFERPIRPGDFVTVGEVEGFVRSIRIRATEIETLDNQNVLLPNSELVSGLVTNWVLRDTYGRLRLQVGVAYGSDVDKVREILEEIANEHPEVITDGRAPAPRALFMSFGDSSLNFEVRVRIQRIDRRFTVQSDLNFAIDEAFRREGITIPFPQRDLHIITSPESAEDAAKAAQHPERDEFTSTRILSPSDPTRQHQEAVDLPATLEDTWQAITDIDVLKKWLVRDGTFTPRIGGTFELMLRDESDVSGRIDVYMPPRRLRMVIALRDGEEPLPTGPITVELQVREKNEGTQLKVTVSGIPATEDWEEDYRRSVDRWKNAFAELQDVISRG
ncbi:MAG: mechanosensitive ion channel [Gammaproteobacteria bacterium]|nr:mechanosensitive ion channel [Gammaproteobacteria bacterium]